MNSSVLEKFDKWKEFLADRIAQAKKVGMGDETISKMAFQIGEFLEDKIDPKNVEERLLKDLWSVGTEEERQVLAGLMVKYVEQK